MASLSRQARLQQCCWELLECLPCRKTLHADDIEPVLAVFSILQGRIEQKELGFAVNSLQGLPQGREHQKSVTARALMPSR